MSPRSSTPLGANSTSCGGRQFNENKHQKRSDTATSRCSMATGPPSRRISATSTASPPRSSRRGRPGRTTPATSPRSSRTERPGCPSMGKKLYLTKIRNKTLWMWRLSGRNLIFSFEMENNHFSFVIEYSSFILIMLK